jgi:hypothetical protein
MNSIILPLQPQRYFNHSKWTVKLISLRELYQASIFVPINIMLFASNIYRNRYKLLCSLFQYFVNFISRVYTSMCRNFCLYCNVLTPKWPPSWIINLKTSPTFSSLLCAEEMRRRWHCSFNICMHPSVANDWQHIATYITTAYLINFLWQDILRLF